MVIQKWATWVFGALNLIVGGFLALHIDWTAVWAATPAPLSAVLIGCRDHGCGHRYRLGQRRRGHVALSA